MSFAIDAVSRGLHRGLITVISMQAEERGRDRRVNGLHQGHGSNEKDLPTSRPVRVAPTQVPV
jgi:hypothetical protein